MKKCQKGWGNNYTMLCWRKPLYPSGDPADAARTLYHSIIQQRRRSGKWLFRRRTFASWDYYGPAHQHKLFNNWWYCGLTVSETQTFIFYHQSFRKLDTLLCNILICIFASFIIFISRKLKNSTQKIYIKSKISSYIFTADNNKSIIKLFKKLKIFYKINFLFGINKE